MRVAVATLLVAALTPRITLAQSNRWEGQVSDQLQRAAAALTDRRGGGAPRVELTRVGTLNAEESASFTLSLRSGVEYAMISVCDQDCTNVQLVLSTASGNELTADRHGETFPLLRFTPRETGTYRVKVTMAACQMNPCWYGIEVYRK